MDTRSEVCRIEPNPFGKKHFSQAQVTPFGTPEIQDLMRWLGMSPICQEFMMGKVSEPLMNICKFPSAKALFERFVEDTFQPALVKITLEEMKNAYQIWPERTATLRSSCNLSHYKELLVQDEAKKKYDTGERILQLHHTMMEATIKTKVVPSH